MQSSYLLWLVLDLYFGVVASIISIRLNMEYTCTRDEWIYFLGDLILDEYYDQLHQSRTKAIVKQKNKKGKRITG